MNRKLFGYFISLIFISLILIIGIFYFLNNKKNNVEQFKNIELSNNIKNLSENSNVISEFKKNKIIERKKVDGEDLKRVACSFVERFGSYSNHSNYNNIFDLEIFMTKKMQVLANKYVQEVKQKNNLTNSYYGITTKSILAEEKIFDNEKEYAEIIVKTQRRESSDVMHNILVFYQDILLKFVKERNVWKVDEVHWQ